MALESGADVKIGDYSFTLDNSVEEPYAHVLESLYSDTQKIEGLDATTANPNVLLWTHDDFAGGAENKYYNIDIPDTYWYGNNNPRIRGSMTSPPDAALNTETLTAGSPTSWRVAFGGGYAWAGANQNGYYTSDGQGWSLWNSTVVFAAGYVIDGMAHDGANLWATALSTGATTRKTYRIDSTTAVTTAISDIAGTSTAMKGMCMLEGNIYMWSGSDLYKYDSTASLPITHDDATHKVHSPFVAAGTYGGIAASDNSVIYFTAVEGQTSVFEYRFSSAEQTFIPRPIWNPPTGFTARYIAVSMGVVYLLGSYGDQVALYGMSLTNREPLFLSFVGQQYGANGTTLTPRSLASSYGAQVTMCVSDATNNYYFVYDAENDALSQLDYKATATDGTNYAMLTFKNRRIAIGNAADTTANMRYWKQDFDTPTGAWTWISSAHHIGYPMDEKLLFGFQVVQDPSIAAGTVQVEYQIDESGSWVSAGTTGAGVKYTNFDLSANNVKFRILRLRLTGASGARLFSVTARSYINSYQELWRLVLKLKNERPNPQASGRPAARQLQAEQLRDYLNTLATTKSAVTFLDGRHSANPNDYSTHTVVVEFPRSGGTRLGASHEGNAEVVLRSTAP